MKKILIFIALAGVSLFTYSQSTVLLRGDTIKVYKQGDTATLKVEGEVMITHYKAGASTDSLLRWDPVSKKLRMTDAAGIGGGDNIYNSNGILSANRTLTGLNNTYSLNLDSLNSWRVQRNGITRFSMSSTTSSMIGANTNAAFSANSTQAIMNYQGNALRVAVDSSTITKILSYETNINGSLTPNAHATKSYVDSVAASSAPTLQTVTTAGNQTTDEIGSDIIKVWPTFSGSRYTSNWVSNLGYSGNGVSAEGNINLRAFSTGGGNIATITPRADLAQDITLRLPNTGNIEDTLATLADVRAGGGGGSGTIVDSATNGIMKFIDYNRSYKLKQNYNPTGTVTINVDSAAQVIWYLTSTGGRTLAFSNLRRGDIFLLSLDNTSGSNITLTLPSNSYVNLVSAATAVIPSAKSSLALAHYDGTNYWFTQSITGGGTAFVQDGNSFGASAVLGTNDNNSLAFEINNSTKLTIGTSATRRIQLGDLTLTSTATPEQISMGGTYNNALGASPKLKILDDGTNISGIGFGLNGTAEQSYYLSASTWHHTFYGGAVKILDMIPNLKKVIIGDGTTTVNDPYILSFGTDLSYSPFSGLKIALYDNGASSSGFGLSQGGTTQVNYVAASTIYHSFYNNGAKTFNLSSSQGNFTGKVYIGDSSATANSSLHVSGSLALKYTSTATSIGLDATHQTVEVTATGQTITLPTAVGITGRVYTIKLTASGSCTVATTSSQNIDASTTYSLASQYKFVTVMSNNANWIVIGSN